MNCKWVIYSQKPNYTDNRYFDKFKFTQKEKFRGNVISEKLLWRCNG